MQVTLLFFTKIISPTHPTQILFGLNGNALPLVSVTKHTLHEFVRQYSLKRHEKFDGYVNQKSFRCFLLEWDNATGPLPTAMELFKQKMTFQWLDFPKAKAALKDGVNKNFLQLAVQYISSDNIDDSIIAADFDEDFLKKLKNKIK